MSKAPLLNWIELSQAALENNVNSLSRLATGKLLAVSVKANAYGHGLVEIVGMLKSNEKVHYLTVHSVGEAEKCRKAGWQRPILLLGPLSPPEIESVFELDLDPAIVEKRTLKALGRRGDKLGKEVRTHLKLETGTNRQGIAERDLASFAEVYRAHKSLGRPFAAYTHFANIEDTTVHEFAESQLAEFRRLTSRMAEAGIKPKIRHTASSAATILFSKTHFDMVRPGIALYGHWPSKETYLSYRLEGGHNNLFTPVLSWKSRITQLKDLPADSFIGYGCMYRTTSRTKLGIVPIGYSEGYARSISNQGYMLVRGRRAPVRGRVCMNITMIDVTDIRQVRLHDEVVIVGRAGDERVSAERLADWAGTINYEILARFSPTTSRLVVA